MDQTESTGLRHAQTIAARVAGDRPAGCSATSTLGGARVQRRRPSTWRWRSCVECSRWRSGRGGLRRTAAPGRSPTRTRRGCAAASSPASRWEALAARLPDVLGDVIRFLSFSAWRVGEVRSLEWRDYDRHDGVIRLRPERSKNRHGRILPVDRGELAAIIARRWQARRLDCPYIFHRNGRRIGDFRKLWAKGCAALGLTGRIVHDLRRSGVRHLIRGGTPPHTVMAFSGHRTASMLKRYDIIDVDDLRRAAERASAYQGEPATVHPLRDIEGGEKTDRTPTASDRS